MRIKTFFIAGVLVAALAGCQRGGYDFVPENLVGVWETTHEKYSDRIFELRTDEIIFGPGGDSFARHSVVNVQEFEGDDGLLYTVYYLGSEGAEYQFAFYYDPTRDTIRFKNQATFEWTRSSTG